MTSTSENSFQVIYMSAQNVAHHQRLAEAAAELVRQSKELQERSRQARSMSLEIVRQVEQQFTRRSA